MNNLLPVATSSATQTVFFTSTGIEKGLTLFGAVVLLLLALIGVFTIIKAIVKNNINMKKIG